MTVKLVAITPRSVRRDPNTIRNELNGNMRSYLELCKKLVSEYPAQQPDSRYVRTGTLGRGWEIKVKRFAVEGTLTNDTPYAVFASGPYGQGIRNAKYERQTILMRSLGWKSITDVARETRPIYVGLVNRSIKGKATTSSARAI